MKGWQIGAVAVVGVVAVGAAGAPFVIGMQAQKSFSNSLSAAAQPGGPKLELKSYQRGWFSSEAVSELVLPGDGGRVELVHTIAHGPFLASRALFDSTTRPRFAGTDAQRARFYFGDKAPFTLSYRMAMDGSQSMTLEVPGYDGALMEDPKVKVAWQGMSGLLEVNAAKDRLNGRLESASLKVNDPAVGGEVEMRGLRVGLKAERREKLWFGDGEFNLEKVSAPGNGAERIRLAAFQRIDGNRVTVGWSGEMGALTIEGKPWGRSEYAFELANLDAAVLADIQTRSETIARESSMQDADAQMQKLMMEAMPKLLASQPRFTLSKLNVQTPSGTVTGKLDLEYKGEAAASPDAMLKAVVGSAELRVPRALAEQIATSFVQDQVAFRMERGEDQDDEPTPEQVASATREQTEVLIRDLIAQSLVVAEGDNLASRAKLSGGKLYVNDQLIQDFSEVSASGS